jgi:putative acetyltransferase
MIRIIAGDLNDPRVVDLVRHHVMRGRTETAPGSAHALDVAGLASPDITFWTLWKDETLAGTGALKRLSADYGEVKSMHTVESMRGRGVGSAMLSHIITAARASGISRLYLETGTWEYFAPARAFYRSHGFTECPPSGDYILDPNSVFMSFGLDHPSACGHGEI